MMFDWISPVLRNMLPVVGKVGLSWLNVPTTPAPGSIGVTPAFGMNIDGVSVSCTSATDLKTCRAASVGGEPIKKQVDNRGTQKVVNNVVPMQVQAVYSAGTVGKITSVISARDSRVSPQPITTHNIMSWSSLGRL